MSASFATSITLQKNALMSCGSKSSIVPAMAFNTRLLAKLDVLAVVVQVRTPGGAVRHMEKKSLHPISRLGGGRPCQMCLE